MDSYTCECGSKNVKVIESSKGLKRAFFFIMPLVFILLGIIFYFIFGDYDLTPLIVIFIIEQIFIYLLMKRSKNYRIVCQDCLANYETNTLD